MRIDTEVVQIWLGSGLPPGAVLNCMVKTRAQAKEYCLVTSPHSNLHSILKPTTTLTPEVLMDYAVEGRPQLRYALHRFGGERAEADVLRFAYLAIYPEALYVDCDCIITEPLPLKAYKAPTFARYGEETDIFLIYGAGQGDFFKGCLDGLHMGQGENGLRRMVKNQLSRFPKKSYHHGKQYAAHI